jgi:restriction system protein
MKYLEQFPEFVAFRTSRKEVERLPTDREEVYVKQTPRELLEDGHQRIRGELVQDLLNRVKDCSPEFFERMVVELLVKMGYGGSQKDAGKAIGRTGDEGIDGIIKEEKLGLDVISNFHSFKLDRMVDSNSFALMESVIKKTLATCGQNFLSEISLDQIGQR